MFFIALILIGVILHVFSINLCLTIIEKIKNNEKRINPYTFIILLILLFIVSYLLYTVLMIKHVNNIDSHDISVSVIFLFGAIFVFTILKINLRLIGTIKDHAEKLLFLNNEIKEANDELDKKNKNLKNLQKDLLNKNTELEELLDDFYTIRLSMAEHMKTDEYIEENKKIKKRIDELK